jgi:hypothetical protein
MTSWIASSTIGLKGVVSHDNWLHGLGYDYGRSWGGMCSLHHNTCVNWLLVIRIMVGLEGACVNWLLVTWIMIG